MAVYKNILVGTDGSATAAIAVDKAIEVAAATGAKLTVFSAGKSPKADRWSTRRWPGSRWPASRRWPARPSTRRPPTRSVAEAVSGNYDLLVLGNKGMQGIGRFVANSVPNKVSKMSPCALLIVRTT